MGQHDGGAGARGRDRRGLMVGAVSLIGPATEWVVTHYPYNCHHLMKSLEWLDRIAPPAREAVRLATLTHDMERAFPGPDQPIDARLNDDAYYKAHAERSARIVAAWVQDQGAEPMLVEDVEALVRAHEFGGWPEANLVQAADSLSFLETNVDLFLGFASAGRFPARDVGIKFDRTYQRIQVPAAKLLALPMLRAARRRLATLGLN